MQTINYSQIVGYHHARKGRPLRKPTRGELDTILTLAYAMALHGWIVEQTAPPAPDASTDEQIEYITMLSLADSVREQVMEAYKGYDCAVSEEQVKEIDKKIDKLKAKMWSKPQTMQVYCSFVLKRISDHLEIPKRKLKNGRVVPKKSGWIKNKGIRESLKAVNSCVYSLLQHFDPETDDVDAMDNGKEAQRYWATL